MKYSTTKDDPLHLSRCRKYPPPRLWNKLKLTFADISLLRKWSIQKSMSLALVFLVLFKHFLATLTSTLPNVENISFICCQSCIWSWTTMCRDSSSIRARYRSLTKSERRTTRSRLNRKTSKDKLTRSTSKRKYKLQLNLGKKEWTNR